MLRVKTLRLAMLGAILFLSLISKARTENSAAKITPITPDPPTACIQDLAKIEFKLPGPKKAGDICASAQRLEICESVEKRSIHHFEFSGSANEKGKRILVFSQIHGDEGPSKLMGYRWVQRLQRINPKNHWRVVPNLNPDGELLGTRTNARKVDLNRNFPSENWDKDALSFWRTRAASNIRRYPGDSASSEPETKCAIRHIEDFKPDVVVSIHTPYGILDYDGPKELKPDFLPLPWRSLGTFPGSLGQYLWVDRGIPVLTVELRTNSMETQAAAFDRFQDEISELVKRNP